MLLPNELKYNIAIFCIPSSLASLAQVHTSYPQEAERVSYQKVHICIWDPKGMCCIDTLSSISEKAYFVRSLTIEFPVNRYKNLYETHKAASLLPIALFHMEALSDLRIRLPELCKDRFYSLVEMITDTICNQYFQLHTLYCNDYLDITGIIKEQRQLQLLGVYGNDVRELLEHLDDMPLTLPTVFALSRLNLSVLSSFDYIQMFPVFSTNPSACRALAASFDQDVSRMVVAKNKVIKVSVWLKDFSDTTVIRDVVEDMSLYFPKIVSLDFVLRCPSRTVQPEIKNILSLLPNLATLSFRFWGLENIGMDRSWVLPVTLKNSLAKEWMAACNNLCKILFLDKFVVEKD